VAPKIYPVLFGDKLIESVGGAEVQQAFIARGLRDAGYRVSVASFDYGQADDAEIDGIRVYKIHQKGWNIPIIRYFHPHLTSIWDVMHRADADIYYQRCAGAYAAIMAAFARWHGRKFIYAGACDKDFIPHDKTLVKLWRDRWLFTLGLHWADAIVAQNPCQVEACHKWHQREANLIFNGYPPPPGTKASNDGVVLWVSVMRQMKRPDVLLDLAERLPHIRFRMIGGRSTTGQENEYYDHIEARARTLANVEFIGFVPYSEVEKYYDDARLFVSTSEFEGFPNTFLQCWARGVPTVSFVDCGARDGGRPLGAVVANLDEMTAAVDQYWHDDVCLATEGARAQGYFNLNHAPQVIIAKYCELLDRVMAKRAG
jgi:glycosyltransferase involved in cell wall biosynthesis